MSRASKAIERVHELREQLNEEIAAVDNRIRECQSRKGFLESSGLVPEEEALARFEKDLDSAAHKGEYEFRRMAELYAKSAGPGISGISARISARLLPNGSVNDPGPILAYLMRDQIMEQGRTVIRKRCQDEKQQHRKVPLEDDRRAELQQIEEEIEQLQNDRNELQDELSRSFNFQPSQETQNRERRAREQDLIDGLNKSSREPGPEPTDIVRTPEP